MATQLFFRTAISNPVDWSRGQGDADLVGTTQNWMPASLSTSRGAGTATLGRTSVTGPTNGLEAGTNVEFISEPLNADTTISGNVTFNLWGNEGANANNTGLGCIVQRLDSQGAIVSTIVDNIEIGVELTTSSAVRNEISTPTSTSMGKGDRFRIRVYFNDAVTVTMGSGGALIFTYNGGTAAASGDSYISFTENFGFLTTAPSGSVLYLTDTASAVNVGIGTNEKEAWTSRGSGVVSKSTDPATGPTVPLQLQNGTGSTTEIEWYTRQLTAFTLSGLVACNLRAAENNAAINAAIRCEIAVCASDGTGAVVWGASNDGVELAASEAAMTFNVAGNDTAITDGQRLRIRIYYDDAPGVAMAAPGGGSFPILYYAGTSAAASGDTYITLPQTVTEFSTGVVTNQLVTVGGRGITQALYPTASG